MISVSRRCCFFYSSLLLYSPFFSSSLKKDGMFLFPSVWGCAVCVDQMALLRRWVPWYGRYSFAVIWNWIRGTGEGDRDDEEYQSFCLLCEVICGSTESAIMKVHLFTTEGLWVNLLCPRGWTWKNRSKSSTKEVLSIQFWLLHTSAHNIKEPTLEELAAMQRSGKAPIALSVLFYHPLLVQS